MLTDHSYQLLETAATESLERIRADRARAPQRLKPLLAYIEDNLFDPTLDVNQLKRSCGVRDNSVPIQFHSAVGRPPHGYIEDRRLETACRLLGETNLKIWQISELLGYSSIQVFSRAFSRWSGQRPTLFRKKARHRTLAKRNGSVARNQMFFGPDSLRKALSGDLNAEEASALIDRLLTIYPNSRQSSNGSKASLKDSSGGDDEESDPAVRSLTAKIQGTEIERLRARETLKDIERQPTDRQMAMVDELRIKSPSLFHLLRRRSHRTLSKDPIRSVQLAELALRTVDTLSRRLHDKTLLTNLRTSGWAWLAHAQTEVDSERSEESLAEAARCLRRSDHSPELLADVAFAAGQLRRNQGRLPDAIKQLGEAHRQYEQVGLYDLANEALIALASAQQENGSTEAAIPLLEQALERVGDGTDGTVKLSLLLNLMAALGDTGRHAEAAEVVPRARQLSLAYGTSQHRIRLRWLEGVVFRNLDRFPQAESALLEARDAYSELQDAVHAALVCIDLAELYSKEGRLPELTRLSNSMTPLLGNLRSQDGTLAPFELFHRAAEEQSVTPGVLEEAREALQHSQRLRAAA